MAIKLLFAADMPHVTSTVQRAMCRCVCCWMLQQHYTLQTAPSAAASKKVCLQQKKAVILDRLLGEGERKEEEQLRQDKESKDSKTHAHVKYKKEHSMHGHKTFTLTTELQEQGTEVPKLLKVGFEPTTKGCLGCTKFGRLRHFLVQ